VFSTVWGGTPTATFVRVAFEFSCYSASHNSKAMSLTHRLVESNGVLDSLLLSEHWRREQHTVDALDYSVRSIDVVHSGDGALHTAAGAAVATLACALAEPSLPLGGQWADHEGEVTLHEVTLLCAGEVVTGGLVNAGVVESDLAVGLAAVDDWDNLDTLGGVDGGVVAQVVCEQQGWGGKAALVSM
jgi:hypothetical protein